MMGSLVRVRHAAPFFSMLLTADSSLLLSKLVRSISGKRGGKLDVGFAA